MAETLAGVSLRDPPMEELTLCLVQLSTPRLILPSQVPGLTEMSAVVEALSFLGPCGPVARGATSCIYYDSKHAAGVCLGTIQARHTCSTVACMSAVNVMHPTQITAYHARTHWESG